MSLRTVLLLVVLVSAGFASWQIREQFARGARRAATLSESLYAELPTLATPPAPAATSTGSVTLPILVYHIIRPSYPGDSAAVRAIALTPETFDAELAHLKRAGYHAVGFSALESYFAVGTPLPAKPIILTFDDGWRDQFEYAFPILKKYQDTATFFVFTNALGRSGFFTWDDLHALAAAGMTIGDHTRSHPFLIRITDHRRLRDEIEGSKKLLETRLGVSITAFAYPFGQHDPAIVALVQQAGFASARGDYWSGNAQTPDRLYTLSALNAPTTTERFERRFP